MTPFASNLPLSWEYTGVVIGFLLSLAIFSFVLRDNLLVRLAQYLLVGVSLGYVSVLVWQSVLLPRLFRPMFTESSYLLQSRALPTTEALWLYWIPLGLGLFLWIGGISQFGSPPREGNNIRSWLRFLAIFPAGILAGAAIGAGIAGTIQGTLMPQFLRAAALGLSTTAPELLLTGILTLLITAGVMIHLQIGRSPGTVDRLPAFLRPIIIAWGWIGQRGLWLAAGFIFARVFASRITLLLARLNYFVFEIRDSSFGVWLQAFLERGWQ
jgi:hypothetical protein